MVGGILLKPSCGMACFPQNGPIQCEDFLQAENTSHLIKQSFCSVADVIKTFLTLYIPETPKWDNVADLAATLGWKDLVQNTTGDYFVKGGVSKRFAYEVIEAATRVNYGQVCKNNYIGVSSHTLHFRMLTRSTR